MFGELGQIMGLMKNLPKITEEMTALQERLQKITAEGEAGAGMVKASVNGRMDVVSLKINDEAMKDKELLEDLICGAVNQALAKVRQQAAEETGKAASSLGLPAGFNIPGLSGT